MRATEAAGPHRVPIEAAGPSRAIGAASRVVAMGVLTSRAELLNCESRTGATAQEAAQRQQPHAAAALGTRRGTYSSGPQLGRQR
jgi:hypothetical protein